MLFSILTFLVAFFVLGFLIFIHELGHFLMAKRAGVKVQEFGFGYPPRLFGIKRGETIYSVNLIPWGGFVRVLGMDEPSQAKESYSKASIWRRFLIIVGGVLMNFILGILIFTIGVALGMPPLLTNPKGQNNNLVVAEVVKDSAAQGAGIKKDDIIFGFETAEDLNTFTNSHKGQTVDLTIKKDETQKTIQVVLPNKTDPLGVATEMVVKVKLPIHKAFWLAMQETYLLTREIFIFLGKFVALLFHGQLSKDVAGPVGIYNITSRVLQLGFISSLEFIGLLSVNLAVLNIAPFPALDGGRLIFIILEMIRGKKVITHTVENIVHAIGFVLLILLMIAITFQDILRLRG